MAAPKMKGGLARLLAPKKDGEGDGDDYDGGDDEASEDDYEKLAEEAFPDLDWDEKRVRALKELIMKCVDGA